MTPKEYDAVVQLIEHTAEQMYKRGYAEGKAGKPPTDQPFTMSRETRLLIKTNIEKSLKKR